MNAEKKKKILVVNGPNLNLLGLREPGIYGSATLDECMKALEAHFPQAEFTLFQSNIEGELVDVIQQYGFQLNHVAAPTSRQINPASATATYLSLTMPLTPSC